MEQWVIRIASEHSFRRPSCHTKPRRPIRRSWTTTRDGQLQLSTPSSRRLPYAATGRPTTTIPWAAAPKFRTPPHPQPMFRATTALWPEVSHRKDGREERDPTVCHPSGGALPADFLRQRQGDRAEGWCGRWRLGFTRAAPGSDSSAQCRCLIEHTRTFLAFRISQGNNIAREAKASATFAVSKNEGLPPHGGTFDRGVSMPSVCHDLWCPKPVLAYVCAAQGVLLRGWLLG